MHTQNIRKNKHFNSISLFIILALSSGTTNSNSIYVDQIGIAQGLSQNSIVDIAQDNKGFMWFGTQDGLNKFDGYKFIKYFNNADDPYSLSNKNIMSLLVDKKGVLWVGTLEGLNKYDSQTDRFTSYLHDPNNPLSLSDNSVESLCEDRQAHIWAGTINGLNRFNPQSQVFTRYFHSPDDETSISSNNINKIFIDSTGELWIGTDKGANLYNSNSNNFYRVGNNDHILHSLAITTIAEDQHGHMWFGTANNGIFIYNKNNDEIINYTNSSSDKNSISSNKINTIYKNKKQQIWIGTDDSGLIQYDEKNNRFISYRHNPSDPHSISADNVYSLYEDSSGVLWIGTYTFGISKMNPYGFSLTLVSDKPTKSEPNPQSDIRAIYVDNKQSIWIGSSYNGVKVTDKDGNSRHFYHDPKNNNSLGSNRVYSIYQDKTNTVWVGTLDGWLNKYNPIDHSFTRYQLQANANDSIRHGKVRAILEDSKGLLWVALDGGAVHIFDRDTKKITHFHNNPNNPNSISHDRVFTIHEDRNSNLWLGSFGGGLNKFNRETKTFTVYRHNPDDKSSIGGNFVTTICEDNTKNILWLGISGTGIVRFDLDNQTFKTFGEKDGLPNLTMYGILQDEQGYLWITHNSGISRFDVNKVEFHTYEEQEGLQSNEFNGGAYHKSSDGKFYYGGIHGYNAFFPNEINDNPYKPKVYITDFQLFNKTVSINERYDGRILLPKSILDMASITLSYKDSVFSFEFAALDYALSAKNQYAYKMVGIENNWNYVSSDRRFATYTTLPPGDYKFRVIASNNNGIWNEQGASLSINITPPFWQTWWFRTIIFFIIFLIIFTIYTLRVKSIQKRNKELKLLVKERTAHLEDTLVELGETKDALIEAAHKAGMADTATSVLHNVGNLLNSVTTSAGIISETINTSASSKFLKANELLVENQNNIIEYLEKDPKGNKLISYLIGLGDLFKMERKSINENSQRLMNKIKSINETITAQQRFAKGGKGHFEKLSLIAIVEESLLLQSGSIDRHEITIERQFDKSVPKIRLQKAKLTQILMNLYKNAKDSMDDSHDSRNILTIEIKKDIDNAYIIFKDSGMGIEKDKLEEIFTHGYTTKDKNQGYGLHNCANYMTEMNGKMWAKSDGPGTGATFIMSFPLNHKKNTNTVKTVNLHEIKIA